QTANAPRWLGNVAYVLAYREGGAFRTRGLVFRWHIHGGLRTARKITGCARHARRSCAAHGLLRFLLGERCRGLRIVNFLRVFTCAEVVLHMYARADMPLSDNRLQGTN